MVIHVGGLHDGTQHALNRISIDRAGEMPTWQAAKAMTPKVGGLYPQVWPLNQNRNRKDPLSKKMYTNIGTGIGPNITKEEDLMRLLRFWF